MSSTLSARAAAVLVLSAVLVAPGSAWAQQTPEPQPTNVDSPSPAASPTASPTPVPATCSPMPGFDCSGRSTTTPRPSPTAACPYVEFSVDRSVIAPGEVVTVTARRVLSEPDQTTAANLYRRAPGPEALVRFDTSTDPVVTWPLRLGESHRFLAEYPPSGQNCFPLGRPNGVPLQVDVAPTVTVSAVRRSPLDYSFTGRVVPARAQRLTLWRVDAATGRRTLTSTSSVRPDGSYRFDRRFTGSGRFGFQVDVAAAPSNLAGSSAVRPTVVH